MVKKRGRAKKPGDAVLTFKFKNTLILIKVCYVGYTYMTIIIIANKLNTNVIDIKISVQPKQ